MWTSRHQAQLEKQQGGKKLLPLTVEVPDHVYVLGYTYTCHTYRCYVFTRIGFI